MEKGQVLQWIWNYKGNSLNKETEKKDFKKDLMNWIEANNQINMISVSFCFKQ